MQLIVAERHAVPVVQFSLLLDAGYAADQFASPGVGERGDGDARRGHGDAWTRSRSATSCASLGAELTSGSNLDVSVVGFRR